MPKVLPHMQRVRSRAGGSDENGASGLTNEKIEVRLRLTRAKHEISACRLLDGHRTTVWRHQDAQPPSPG